MIVADLYSRPRTCILLHPSDCIQAAETAHLRQWWDRPWFVDDEYFCSDQYVLRKGRGGIPAPEQVAALNFPHAFYMRSSHEITIKAARVHGERMSSIYVLPTQAHNVRLPERFHDSRLPQNRPSEICRRGWLASGTQTEVVTTVVRARLRSFWQATGARAAGKVIARLPGRLKFRDGKGVRTEGW